MMSECGRGEYEDASTGVVDQMADRVWQLQHGFRHARCQAGAPHLLLPDSTHTVSHIR